MNTQGDTLQISERYAAIPRTLCFIFHRDEVLLVQGSAKKDWQGKYTAVGGHIEKGEDVVESARREIEEETGLYLERVSLRGVLHVTNFFGKDVLLFVTVAESESKEVSANDEGELVWVPKENLQEYDLIEDIKPLLDTILTLKPHQFITGANVFQDGKLVTMDWVIRDA